jgi:hypothetical protein
LPFGTYPADLAAGINVFDALAHTWDIATPAAIPMECPDELWETALAAASALLKPDRDERYYVKERVTSHRAPPRDRFLSLLGRDATGYA